MVIEYGFGKKKKIYLGRTRTKILKKIGIKSDGLFPFKKSFNVLIK